MSPEQRAIIAAAEKDGVSPIEKDARLIVHGMVNATRDQMRRYQVCYNNMGEAQQDAVIAELTKNYEELAITIARAISSAGSPYVVAQCKKLEVSTGACTVVIKSDQDHYNELISKVQDKGEVVIVLYERQFRDGMDTIQADKDQHSLPLDQESPSPASAKKAEKKEPSPTSAAAIAAKPVVIPPKLLADAIEFIAKQQVCGASSLQNHLKIGHPKALAIQAELAEKGILSVDEKGEYQIVRTGAGPAPTDDGDVPAISDELFEKIKAKVVADGSATVSGTSVFFDIDEAQAIEAIDELTRDGILDYEDAATGVYAVAQPA